MRQPGRGGRRCPRPLGAWPRDTQAPTDLYRVRADRAETGSRDEG